MRQGQRRRAALWITGGMVLAIALGMVTGSSLYRIAQGGGSGDLTFGQRAGAPTSHASLPTPPPTASPDQATALLQQFDAALVSSDAQPIDARSGMRLVIPRLQIDAPVVERGVVGGAMVVAPGYTVTHFAYSAYPGAPGNAVLYAHDGTVFRHLDKLAVGDTMRVQTPSGAAPFRVREIRIVSPDAIAVLDATPNSVLTLLTCYPYGIDTSRLVVIADLVVN